ncbi:hypothetical protein Pmani_019810 [Petrolisthes manimaculis]|uniref:Endothelin-converting enzyme-like 1 n=1 Tax=Petrolisthes manimaculis TaxID=1843537 RepID=A0AAE1U790_9EUCA|nr:hypothetical protein Pmani_019810 [Petrolisthes manimaculis]
MNSYTEEEASVGVVVVAPVRSTPPVTHPKRFSSQSHRPNAVQTQSVRSLPTHPEQQNEDTSTHNPGSLSRTLRSMVPRVLTPAFSQQQTGADTSGADATDCGEGVRLRKPSSRDTERWMVGISAAGVIVSGLVLIIVLYPLVTPPYSYPKSSLHDKSNLQPEARVSDVYAVSERSPRSRWNDVQRKPHNSPSFHKPQEEPPELQDFYNMMVTNTDKYMDRSIDPCQDFYQYACGNWGKYNPPPEGVTSWSNFEDMTLDIWSQLEDEIQLQLNISDSYLAHAHPAVRDLVLNYYSACENDTHLTKEGVGPLQVILKTMDKKYSDASKMLQPLQSFQQMLEYVHHHLAIHTFFSWKVETDNKIQSAMAIELRAPNTDILPQGTDVKNNKDLIAAYKLHTSKLLEMVGTYNNNNIEEEVTIILEMMKTYLPLTGSPLINDTNTEKLNAVAPFLDWQTYFNNLFNEMGIYINKEERILSLIQDYLMAISKEILSEISIHGSERLYKYLRWQVIHYYSHYLHQEARNTLLPLLDIVTGQNTTALPNFRYRPCIKELEEKFALPTTYLLLELLNHQHKGDAVREMITNVKHMANNIRHEYISFIDSFTWLKPSAKRILLDKLKKVKILVGYPSLLDNISELEDVLKPISFNRTTFLKNQISLQQFNLRRQMSFLRQPGLYSEWEILSPMSLLSFYMYRRNTLLVPLGGFRYPLYTADLPGPLTYATMGMFISHELGHAVDFVGRTRDEYGRANASMWDDNTVQVFAEKVMCRVKQYSRKYYPVTGLLTIAEVMADDGSVRTTFEAARESLRHTRFPTQVVNLMKKLDITPDQLFFITFAQLFCTATHPNTPLTGIDHYPPHPTRVNATLANTPQFHTAFSCPINSKMNNMNEYCDIW